ncbi:MAG: universal stress protein [Armatimonadota bacterium]|jgi:nucleotide-binding universal stress UspA family protein
MRVLITTDGSEDSYKAVRSYIHLTHATQHDINILYVMPRIAIGRDAGYFQLEQEREAAGALNTVKEIFREVGEVIKTELKQGDAAQAIVQVAKDGEYDLIVMGRKGRGGFREYLLGSVSRYVVQNAPCSVFIGR